MEFPSHLRYTVHDEWVSVDGDLVTIGITAFAQDALGELVHVELPSVGATVAAGGAICEVESVKAVAEVFTPVAGEIVEINEALKDDPQLVNEDPHADGWLVKIKYSDSSDFDELMNVEEYEAFTKEGK